MIQAVIFDMDGTIFDTERLVVRAMNELATRGVVPKDLPSRMPSIRGKNYATILSELQKIYGEDAPIDQWFDARRSLMAEITDREGIPLKSGVPQIFEALRAMNLPMALATSTGEASVARYMRLTGYGAYFDGIVTGNRVTNGKPAPDIFLLAAKELGVEPADCLVVEDSPNGVRAGHAAGMKVIMVPDLDPINAELEPLVWHCCETLSEIPDLIQKENENKEK